jgi:hypothetical protein
MVLLLRCVVGTLLNIHSAQTLKTCVRARSAASHLDPNYTHFSQTPHDLVITRILPISPKMDYLELEDSAMLAFEELGGNFISEHVLSKPVASTSAPLTRRSRRRVEASYLIRLRGPFPTPRDIANALGLSRVPQLENGEAEDGEASFCRLSESSVNALDVWVRKHHPNHNMTKVRVGLAHKDFGDLPVLGRDPTLPHHRPQTAVGTVKQRVLEYPVHYFFYGTLADPERLERLLGIPASGLSPLQPATVLDGHVEIWAGKYRALVDAPGAKADGFAYAVTSSDQEEALRVYEGDHYEVVAARIVVGGQEIVGRTFRFAGFENELTQ